MPQGPYLQAVHAVPSGPEGYLLGGGVGFGEAVKLAFQNTFTYQGRASRSAYWWFALFSGIVGLVLEVVTVAAHSAGVSVLLALVSLALFLVSLPLLVRRLHDVDRSGWWVLIELTIVGSIVLFVFSVLEGTRGPNRFGG